MTEQDPHTDWGIPNLRPHIEQADADIKALAAVTNLEPIGYDGFGAPLYEHQVDDPYPAFVSRWIAGIDPADLDDDVKMTIAWGDVFPITVETRVRFLEDEVVELLWGGDVIPLCDRRIPTRGTE